MSWWTPDMDPVEGAIARLESESWDDSAEAVRKLRAENVRLTETLEKAEALPARLYDVAWSAMVDKHGTKKSIDTGCAMLVAMAKLIPGFTPPVTPTEEAARRAHRAKDRAHAVRMIQAGLDAGWKAVRLYCHDHVSDRIKAVDAAAVLASIEAGAAASSSYWVGLHGAGFPQPSTEVKGGGYRRVRWAGPRAPVTFPEATEDWGPITCCVLYDAEIGGTILDACQFVVPRDVRKGGIVEVEGDLMRDGAEARRNGNG